jgi:hypothetical protein
MANSIKDCVTMVNSVRGKDLVFGIGHGKFPYAPAWDLQSGTDLALSATQ